MLREKATAFLRALPKSICRELMPLPDVAQAFSACEQGWCDRTAGYPVEGLRAGLRRYLRSARGVQSPSAAWPADSCFVNCRFI
ncbi:MAG: DUF3418 domain-containing protein [Gammaproteobacteria bacterium]